MHSLMLPFLGLLKQNVRDMRRLLVLAHSFGVRMVMDVSAAVSVVVLGRSRVARHSLVSWWMLCGRLGWRCSAMSALVLWFSLIAVLWLVSMLSSRMLWQNVARVLMLVMLSAMLLMVALVGRSLRVANMLIFQATQVLTTLDWRGSV